MLRPRRRVSRRDERGQVLMLALAFIAFFGLVLGAAFGFANVASRQHVNTEAAAASDSPAEGAAGFAAADAANIPGQWTCTYNAASTPPYSDFGSLTMNDAASSRVSYSLAPQSCDPGNTSLTSSSGGGHCLLCILNQTPIPPATSPSATTTVLTAQCAGGSGCTSALQTTGGDDYVNGAIASGTTLTACSAAGSCPGKAIIGVLAPLPSACTCSPSPSQSKTRVADPLNGIGDPASMSIALPSGCTSWPTCQPSGCTAAPLNGSWSATQGCSVSLSKSGSYTLNPGVWHSISISGQAGNVTMQPGAFVLTGAVSVSGQGGLCAGGTISGSACNAPSGTGVGTTLYLACPGGTVSGKSYAYLACATSGTGGSLSFSGKGNASIYSPACPSGEIVPQCPGYDGVAVLSDPALVDPGGVSGCVGSGTGCDVSIAGNGNSINGSVDTRSAGVSLSGGGSDAINLGFLVTNSLFINDNGKAGTGWALSGPGSYSSTGLTSCVLVLNVYGGPSSPVPSPAAVAIVQSQCVKGANTYSGVVDFKYGH